MIDPCCGASYCSHSIAALAIRDEPLARQRSIEASKFLRVYLELGKFPVSGFVHTCHSFICHHDSQISACVVYAVEAYLPIVRTLCYRAEQACAARRARAAAKGAVILAEDTAWTDAMDASIQDTDRRTEAPSDEIPEGARGSLVARAHRVVADDLYGAIPVSRWAQSLLEAPPFRRLDGVSLSDVPGELLFGRSFPSRLTHSLGVYYLTRQARPRDRALQAAALAHDLGHGPFSHLSEPLMIERIGIDHEQRSAALLREAVTR